MPGLFLPISRRWRLHEAKLRSLASTWVLAHQSRIRVRRLELFQVSCLLLLEAGVFGFEEGVCVCV